MTDQTKMIIITSNEDIIRQFTSNQYKNTHIIDIDTNGNRLNALTGSTELVCS